MARKFTEKISENFWLQYKTIGLVIAAIDICFAFPVFLNLQNSIFSYWQIMQFNTAIGISAIGVSLLAAVLKSNYLSRMAALLILLIGGLTFFQHVTGVDLHIDNLVRANRAVIYLEHPGRMAFYTSVSFVLLGVGLLLFNFSIQAGRVLNFVGVISGAVASLGLISLFAPDFTEYSEFGSAAKMTRIAGIVFLISGLYLMATCMQKLGQSTKDRYRLIPMTATIMINLVAFSVWQNSVYNEEKRVGHELQLKATSAKIALSDNLNQTANAMKSFASRIAITGIKDREYLRVDSQNYLDQLSFINRLGITDASSRVIWTYPMELQRQVTDFLQTNDPVWREAFIQAKDTKEPSMTRSIRLKSGELGSLLPVVQLRDTKFIGYSYATLALDRLFLNYVNPDQFQLQVIEDGKIIFEKFSTTAAFTKYSIEQSFDFGFAHWRILIFPTERYLLSLQDPSPFYILCFGQFLAIILGLLLQTYFFGIQKKRLFLEEEEKSYRKLNSVLEAGNQVIFSHNLATGNIWRSKKHDELFGYKTPFESWRFETFLSHVHAEDKERILEYQQKSMASEGYNTEFRIVRDDDKSLRWLSLQASATFDEVGRPISIDGIFCDITEEKNANDELQLAYSRLKRVVEASGEGIWERDFGSGNILYFDDMCRSIFGFERNEEPTFQEIKSLFHPDDEAMYAQYISNHIAGKIPQFDFELRIRDRRNPEIVKWVRVRGKLLKRPGLPDQLVSTLCDVTELVKNRIKLERAVQSAERALKDKSAFFASMSHEIRTPLNGIIGMTDLLLETKLDEKQKNFAQIVQQSGSALLNLINDILDFSKIESGKLEIEETQINIADVVESQVDILMAKAKQKKLSLVSYVAPNLPPNVAGDSGRIGQVLLNLIGNSLKFTASGGVSINVEKGQNSGKVSDYVLFKIVDTGIGMSQEVVKKLFNPFTQADESITRKFGGTGLGLSISKKIVEAMGGTIGVKSSPGLGSTFWFEIPMRQIETLLGERKIGWEKVIGKRALVIEQDPIARESLNKYILGFKMRNGSVSSPPEAEAFLKSAFLQKDPYNLIIISGFSSGEAKKMIDNFKKTLGNELPRMLFVSEFGDNLTSEDLIRGEVSGCISKPLKQSRLLDSMVLALSETDEFTEFRAGPPSEIPKKINLCNGIK